MIEIKKTQEVLYNKNNHPFLIRKTYRKNGHTYCEVEFLETCSIRKVRKSVVNERSVKDRYAKDVCGVACIGNAKKVDHLKEYTIWKNMIERCYNPKNKYYHVYGGNDVSVCERWLCFEHFLEDLPLIEGYDEEKFYSGEIQLDKDKKQLNINNKVYSLETCTFVSQEENHSMRKLPKIVMKSVKTKCVAISENGSEIFVDHIPSFAKKYNLQASKIYECVKGIRKQHKGWRFRKWE